MISLGEVKTRENYSWKTQNLIMENKLFERYPLIKVKWGKIIYLDQILFTLWKHPITGNQMMSLMYQKPMEKDLALYLYMQVENMDSFITLLDCGRFNKKTGNYHSNMDLGYF